MFREELGKLFTAFRLSASEGNWVFGGKERRNGDMVVSFGMQAPRPFFP